MNTIVTISLIVVSCLALRAQQLDVVADVVQFRGNGAEAQWELHYSFSDTTLRYVVAPTGFVGEMLCSLSVIQDTQVVVSDVWIAAAESRTAVPVHSRYYAGIRTLALPPGTYTVNFEAVDANDRTRRTTATFSTKVEGISSRAGMSDIMFVMPKEVSADPRFVRAGQPCDPNPRHELTGLAPALGVYVEFYNAKLAGLDTSYAELSVFNNVRDEEFTTYIPVVGASNNLAIRQEFQLDNLRTGIYSLRIRLLAKDKSKVLDSREERLYILNPAMPPEQQKLLTEDEDFQASEWSIATGDKLKLELELCEVLASKGEIETKKQCTDERSQQRFLYRFWKVRDTDESTPANERLDEFRKMITRAQSMYSSIVFSEGWRSDRGRILLRYGQPTRVKQYFQTREHKAYEKWWYQGIQGGACFTFVDVNQQQDHRLVHSTVIGWIFEPNWYRLYAMIKNVDQLDVNSISKMMPQSGTTLSRNLEDPNDDMPDCGNVSSP
jgi:GWxTD domain-containing protein